MTKIVNNWRVGHNGGVMTYKLHILDADYDGNL